MKNKKEGNILKRNKKKNYLIIIKKKLREKFSKYLKNKFKLLP